MENFTFREMRVGEKLMGKSERFFLLSFITLVICSLVYNLIVCHHH